MPATKATAKKVSLSSKPYRTIKSSGQTGSVSQKVATMAVRKAMASSSLARHSKRVENASIRLR